MQGTANLLLNIRALLPALNEQEQKVGQYILNHPAEVVHLSMSDLAGRCAASDATIFRFCKKVGTEGYQDLKIRLAQEVATGRSAAYVQALSGDSLATVAHKVIAADIKALQDTLDMLDLAALERAVEVLLSAGRVDVYGSGGAAVAAFELQYKLIRVGVRAVAHVDAEMQIISATQLTSSDVAVGISHSGASQEIRRALEVARQAGATLVTLTNHPASPIAQLADVSLVTAAQEALAHAYTLGARVAQVSLTDILYTCMALRRPRETQQSLERIAEALYRRPT